MKSPITQFSITVIAFAVIFSLMSYTRPSVEEPKQYSVVMKGNCSVAEFEEAVNQKIAEGWRPQGGYFSAGASRYQAMVK